MAWSLSPAGTKNAKEGCEVHRGIGSGQARGLLKRTRRLSRNRRDFCRTAATGKEEPKEPVKQRETRSEGDKEV